MNWKQEAIDHLQCYEAMLRAVENIPEEISRLEQQAMALRGGNLQTPRVCTTPQPGEDKLIANMVKRQALQQSLANAQSWIKTADAALDVLTPEEKRILLRMYIRPERGAVQLLCQDLCLEQSSVYRRRDTALYRFTIAMYGAA